MLLKKLRVGPLESNCYLIADESTHAGLIIDPGAEGERILKVINKMGITPHYLINTHGHADHIGANSYLKEKIPGLKIGIHQDDASLLTNAGENLSSFAGGALTSPAADFFLREGEEIKIGKILLKVIHTPGHTQGGICLFSKGILISGDTLFANSIGRTDLPGGSMELLLKNIREKLFILPEETRVYPGHGESSTIRAEKKDNPFL